jgi:ABC-2 type transport system permease protein
MRKNNPNPYLSSFLKYRYLLLELVLRDLKVKYRRSVLGYLWSVLNPILMMLVMTLVFSMLFRSSIENYAVYFMSGNLIFSFFSEATTGAQMSVIGAASLIKKVYIPKYLFPLEKCLFSLTTALFSLFALLCIAFATRLPFHPTMLLFPLPILYTFLFSVGMGMILSALTVFFRDMSFLYSVVVLAWMYLTPIMYPVDILPPWVERAMHFNPMFQFVRYFRDIFMYGHIPDLRVNLICLACGVLSISIGIAIFKKAQDRFILYI